MDKLILKKGSEEIKEFDLGNLPALITVGSAADDVISIEDDLIEENHLSIEKSGEGYFVQDFKPGTFLNGKKIRSSFELNGGDCISIGEHELLFYFTEETDDSTKTVMVESEVVKNEAATKFDKTILVDAAEKKEKEDKTEFFEEKDEEKTEFIDEARDEEKTEFLDEGEEELRFPEGGYRSSPPDFQHYLIAIYGPYVGQKFPLILGKTKIGRDAKLNDIVLNKNVKGEKDPSISRRHATIHFDNGRYLISDKRSHTRSYVNQHKLGEEDVVPLELNDEVEIVSDQKSTIFRFVRKDEWNIKPPKKAGVWLIRHRPMAYLVMSVLFSLLSIFLIYDSSARKNAINQKPSPLIVNEELWLSGNETATTPFISDPALADVNGDGFLDFIYVNSAGHVVALNCKTKTKLWQQIESVEAIIPSAIVLADMNNNGLDDIIIAAQNSRVYAFDGQNGLLISKSDFISGNLVGAPAVNDLNNDGNNDITICTENGKLYIGINNLTDMTWQNFSANTITKAVPSIINDNILFGTENGIIKIFNLSTNSFQNINVNESLNAAKGKWTEDHSIRSFIAYGKVSPTRSIIVAATRQYNIISFDLSSNNWLWYDEFITPRAVLPDIHPAPVLGDLDGDGFHDVIFACHNGVIKGYHGYNTISTTSMWEYDTSNDQFVANPALADLNKDNIVDVIAAGTSGIVYILDGSSGKQFYISNAHNSYSTTPLIGDINNDSYLDILCLSNNYDIYRYRTNSKVLRGTVVWSQKSSTPYHSGELTYHSPETSTDTLIIFGSIIVLAVIISLQIRDQLKQKKMLASITH